MLGLTDEVIYVTVAVFYVGFVLLLLKLKISLKDISIINFYLCVVSVFYMLLFDLNKVFIGLAVYTFTSSLAYFVNRAFNKGYDKH